MQGNVEDIQDIVDLDIFPPQLPLDDAFGERTPCGWPGHTTADTCPECLCWEQICGQDPASFTEPRMLHRLEPNLDDTIYNWGDPTMLHDQEILYNHGLHEYREPNNDMADLGGFLDRHLADPTFDDTPSVPGVYWMGQNEPKGVQLQGQQAPVADSSQCAPQVCDSRCLT
jgi:hypothetical protein